MYQKTFVCNKAAKDQMIFYVVPNKDNDKINYKT